MVLTRKFLSGTFMYVQKIIFPQLLALHHQLLDMHALVRFDHINTYVYAKITGLKLT